MAVKRMPMMTFRLMVLPRTCCAVSYFPCPKRTLMTVLAPTPTIAPSAVDRFMNGLATAIPLMAMSPTPCPTKMLSMILYVEAAAMAMMAGTA